jgi:hypothetical protein
MFKEYAWVIVAFVYSSSDDARRELILDESKEWFSNKRACIESIHRQVLRGVAIPDRWGSPVYFILKRSVFVQTINNE